MSECDDTLHDLQTYLDHELSDDDLEMVRTHLAECRNCNDAFEFHARLRATIREKCHHDELPPEFIARIERCLGEDFDGDGRIG